MTTQTEERPPIDGEPPQQPLTGGEMTLLEHLLELRSRVTWAAGAILIGMAPFIYYPFTFWIIDRLLDPAQEQIPDFQAQAITPLETLFVYFRVMLLGGISAAMPMLVYQMLRFIGPALTPSEKRWVYPIVGGASLSFVAGMAFAYFIVLPPAYRFLFSFGSEIATPTPSISSYMDLTLRLILLMGVIFEMPIVIMGLARMRVVHWRKLASWWRFAVIGAFVVSAIATPTIDPVTQSLVAGPMIVLYVVGIVLAWVVRPRGA